MMHKIKIHFWSIDGMTKKRKKGKMSKKMRRNRSQELDETLLQLICATTKYSFCPFDFVNAVLIFRVDTLVEQNGEKS